MFPRNAYYDWLHRSPTAREQADAELAPVIQEIFTKSRATYGTRRIRQSLLRQNLSVGRGRIGRLMVRQGWPARPNENSRRPRIPSITCRSLKIFWIDSLRYKSPTKFTWATSPTSTPKKVGCTWQW
ncbi:MAG: transposase [Methylococcaceae bacterium]|nr:transposase [Methylococcaceae bacterium]